VKASLVRVGDVSEQVRGVSYSKGDASEAAQDGYVPVLRAGNITETGVVFDDLVYIPNDKVSPKQLLRSGDVLIAASSGSLDVVGKAASMLSNYEGAFGAFCKVLRPRAELVAPDYFGHFFKTAEYRRTVSSLAAGANINNLRNEHLDNLLIPLPSLPEQRRIAIILGKADALRVKRREALAQVDRMARSIFVEMFGDTTRNSWPVVPVEQVAADSNGAIRTGPFGSQLLHSEFVDEGIAVLGIDNAVTNEFRWGEKRFITEAKYRTLLRYTVQPGDVLITIMGTCGRCAVVPDEIPLAINTKHLCCITLDRNKCLPTFLHSYFLWHPTARQYLAQTSKGAIMDGLNMGIIKAMPIVIPPVSLQEQFAARLNAIRQCKSAYASAIAQAEDLFSSVQHRAFRGEL
jgi:type I restriction enzyme, S subunit